MAGGVKTQEKFADFSTVDGLARVWLVEAFSVKRFFGKNRPRYHGKMTTVNGPGYPLGVFLDALFGGLTWDNRLDIRVSG
jgi:hypothetical protein